MATDDAAARKARAQRLKEAIARRKSSADQAPAPGEAHEESAAEFVHRRMAELDESQEGGPDAPPRGDQAGTGS